MTTAGDIIEEALYLSIKDRYFNAVPDIDFSLFPMVDEFPGISLVDAPYVANYITQYTALDTAWLTEPKDQNDFPVSSAWPDPGNNIFSGSLDPTGNTAIYEAALLKLDEAHASASTNEALKISLLTQYLSDLNEVLDGIEHKNPAFSYEAQDTAALIKDTNLNVTYLDLENKFSTIYRVEFVYASSSLSITLNRLGMQDFFSNASVRTLSSFPSNFNYNVYTNRLYIYPTSSVGGTFNVFGKKQLGRFETIDDEFLDEVSTTFLLFLQYFLAKHLCSKYNAPWQAQKEDQLRTHRRTVSSENNIVYQENSIGSGRYALPLRNLRQGL